MAYNYSQAPKIDTSWGNLGYDDDPFENFDNSYNYGDDYKSPYEQFDEPESNAPKVDTSWGNTNNFDIGEQTDYGLGFEEFDASDTSYLTDPDFFKQEYKPQSNYGVGYNNEDGYTYSGVDDYSAPEYTPEASYGVDYKPGVGYQDNTSKPGSNYGVNYDEKDGYSGNEYKPGKVEKPKANYGVEYNDKYGYTGKITPPKETEKPGANYGVDYDDNTGYGTPKKTTKPPLSGSQDDQQTNEALPKYETDDDMYEAYVDKYGD